MNAIDAVPARTEAAIRVGYSGTVRRFLALTWLMAYTDFKLRFFGSILGYFWQLVRPLAVFGILYVVFTKFVKIGGTPFYAISLLAGIVMWGFFSEAVGVALGSMVDRESIVRKIPFPLLAVPVAGVVSTFLTFLTNFGAVIIMMVVSGVPLSAGWLEIVPIFVILFATTSGMGVLLAALYVRYRDVRPIWEVVSTAGFYATPVLYPIEFVTNSHPDIARALLLNPVAAAAVQFRHGVLDHNAPSVADVFGSWWGWAAPLGVTALLFFGGVLLFLRRVPTIAEEL